MRKHLATFVEDFERHGNQIAVVSYPGNRRVSTSYAQLAILAGRFSRLLQERKVLPGERVLLWGANSAEWIGAFFGCVLRAVIAVPLDAGGSMEFAVRVISDTSPRLIVGDAQLLQKLPESAAKIYFENFSDVLPQDPLLVPEPSLNPRTTLQILFTSGTTSAPKGIVHTHGNVLASVEVLEREIRKYQRYERWVHPLRILHTLPLSHVFGQFMGLWVAPLLASPVHYEDKLVAGHLIDRIHRERLSVAVIVPRVLDMMRAYLVNADPHLPQRLEENSQRKIWWRWWHLRGMHRRFGFKFWAFVCGGATLPQDVEQFWNILGFVLVQGYGMTETTAIATLNHPFHTARGTIGKPLAGREVRVAEDGEILVRGAMLAAGTWRNGEVEPRTEEWLHTGDLGSVDVDGDVRFLGRKSDIIVVASGMNVHPTDLEAAVQSQPDVRECVVVGWDGPRSAEPVAAVLFNRQIAADEEKAVLQRVLTGANEKLQEFQQIRSALRWPEGEFPRNSAGKLLRREVAQWVRYRLQSTAPGTAFQTHHDPLLRLLEQVTGESAAELDDSADLATSLRLDSLGRMQLAMGMEEQFGVPVNDDEIAAAKTVGDLRDLLRSGRGGLGNDRVRIREAEPTGIRTPQDEITREAATAGEQRTDTETSDASHTAVAPRMESALPKYYRWPWLWPVQALRVAFLECVLRPLVALLASPRVEGDSSALPEAPSIYVCNHVTVVDGALLLYALPRRVRHHMAVAMSAELLTSWRHSQKAVGLAGPLRWLGPFLALLVTALFNVFPLPAGAGLRQSFAHAGEALDRGYNVLVFPEGSRTRTGELQPFQTGISLLSQESRTTVVPLALIGLWQAAQISGIRSWLRPRGLAVVIGTPLRLARRKSHSDFAESLQAAVKHLISIGTQTKSF